jgi:putative Mg2+ transporter-C (MgtC) family protein
MPLHIGWSEIVLRLALTTLAGLLIGYNRTEHGKAAGLRTTLLVCLAASVTMIQVNLLLSMAGRPPDSFVMNDLMRLPLGILTGVGFIGGGAIIRRDNIVVGVTTAATLWYITVVGFCFGAGLIGLGLATTAIGMVALWVLQWFELRLRQESRANLFVEWQGDKLSEADIRSMVEASGLRIAASRLALSASGQRREIAFDLLEYRRPGESSSPALCETLGGREGVVRLEWSRS